jgi:hypothetical protein
MEHLKRQTGKCLNAFLQVICAQLGREAIDFVNLIFNIKYAK